MRLNQDGSARRYPALQIAAVLVLLAIGVFAQWRGESQSVPNTDNVAYLTCGVSLVRTGSYTNPAGRPELWYPPVYPILIGLLSLAGSLDAMIVARLIVAVASAACVILVWSVGRGRERLPRGTGFLAALALACNALFQLRANTALSESVATMLSFAAFAVWLRLGRPRSSWRRYAAFGALVGLSFLSRPEGLLLLPLLGLVDLLRRRSFRVILRYSPALAACLLVILPYVAFLSSHTGRLTLTNKSEVNLAQGRARFYRGSSDRQHIDPDTLELTYFHPDVTLASEARRYVSALGLIGGCYAGVYRTPVGAGLLLAALLGAIRLARDARWRLLLGLAAQFAYLLLLAVYAVSIRYLHATLPALCLLTGIGLAWSIETLRAAGRNVPLRAAAALLCLWAMTGLVEGATRYPRWVREGWGAGPSLLRDAGRALSAKNLHDGTLFAVRDTIPYYSGQLAERLMRDDLGVMTRYMRKFDAPVYMAISDLTRHPPDFQALLEPGSAPYEHIMTFEDQRGRVVVYRVK
jgi:4-amino-4-deoxy-L-arabinose transferase-like glycosyltransferase